MLSEGPNNRGYHAIAYRIETIHQLASSDSEQSLLIPPDEEPRNVSLPRTNDYKYSCTSLAFSISLKTPTYDTITQ